MFHRASIVRGGFVVGVHPSVGMLRDHHVTRDELFAVGATLTLLAWGFAYAFFVCQTWFPGSFTGLQPEHPRSWRVSAIRRWWCHG